MEVASILENKRQQIVVWSALLFLLACQTTAAWAQNSNSSRVEFFQGSVINWSQQDYRSRTLQRLSDFRYH
tara:strand:- start:279 stop:491 length:213 start_codon:yes stop_codon:yes gene_type:complete